MNHEKVWLSNGEVFLIRPFSLKDFRGLHGMYPFFSEETKLAFRSVIFQPRPSIRRMKDLVFWIIIQIKLALSTISPVRQLLMFVPRATYLAFVAVNSTGQIVAFMCLSILGGRKGNKSVAETGRVVRDDYQGKGLGTVFATVVLRASAAKVYKVVATVYEWNTRNIHVNEKLGLKITGYHKNKCGETICTMARNLDLME